MDLPDFFGLDLGNHSIKVAQVKRSANKASLEKIGSINTEVSLLQDDSEEGIQKLANQVKQARESAGITTSNCVAALPESPIFSRQLTIPQVEEDKLKDAVHWELKPLIPVALEEVDIAFLEIGEKDVKGEKMVDVYVVAAPKTLTEKYKKIAELAGINLIALETESLANSRTVSFNYPEEADVMISDFGANGTDMILAKSGIPIFAQTISTGSDAFTKAIAADYGLDMAQAEKYKRAFGIEFDKGDGKIAKSIEPMMQIIINEMSRTLTYLKQRVGDAGAAKVYLCGDGAQLPGLDAYFKSKLGLESVVINPMAKIDMAGSVQKEVSQLQISGFSVAIGLGLKDS